MRTLHDRAPVPLELAETHGRVVRLLGDTASTLYDCLRGESDNPAKIDGVLHDKLVDPRRVKTSDLRQIPYREDARVPGYKGAWVRDALVETWRSARGEEPGKEIKLTLYTPGPELEGEPESLLSRALLPRVDTIGLSNKEESAFVNGWRVAQALPEEDNRPQSERSRLVRADRMSLKVAATATEAVRAAWPSLDTTFYGNTLRNMMYEYLDLGELSDEPPVSPRPAEWYAGHLPGARFLQYEPSPGEQTS